MGVPRAKAVKADGKYPEKPLNLDDSFTWSSLFERNDDSETVAFDLATAPFQGYLDSRKHFERGFMDKSATILIVDDEPLNIDYLEQELEDLDCETIVAEDGELALALTAAELPDLILLDVMMPKMNGFQVLERLKADDRLKHIPTIVVSALNDTNSMTKGIEMGAEDYLSKPFNPVLLKARIGACLERKRLRDLEMLYTQQLEQQVSIRTEELQIAYEQLARLDRHKMDFIGVASHELRTPLTVLRGYSEMLLDDSFIRENDYYQQLIAGIHAGTTRMQDIVNMMLDMVRIDSHTLRLCPKEFSVSWLIDNVCRNFREALVARDQTLVLEDINDLPDIEADIEALEKVFSHLITNAVKYTPDGGVITISGHRYVNGATPDAVGVDASLEDAIEVFISDTGIGIDEQFHHLIFEKFYQTGEVALHSSGKTEFKAGGPGLGLAIARGIVEAHGGKIWVESPGYDETTCPGSNFHVVLPIQ
jgi:signal transduction histidine kinase